MKALLIGTSFICCLYSVQTLDVKTREVRIPKTGHWDDTLVYGPQLPCYYSNAISEYVRRIFQDSKGNLWFGTNSDGLAKYDGKGLAYMNIREGLSGSQVTGILEDRNGNMWFSTNNGITRYDPSAKGQNSQIFTEQDGLSDPGVWSIFQDSKGTIWAGTFRGLCRFTGTRFEAFPIPGAEKSWVRAITEDSKGNLWFATSDKGAYKFNGETFQHLSKKTGLSSNDLTSIAEDHQGNLWFGSMDGGISKYDGKTFTHLLAGKEIGNNEVWTVYEDRNQVVWFSSEGFGVYRYLDGKLTHFGDKEGLHIGAVQAIYHDREGRFWFGGGSGLVLFDGNQLFVPVTKQGPWDMGC